MYRGSSNPDYHRSPVPQSEFGQHAPSFGPSRFCPPYGGPPGRGYCAPPPGPPPGHPFSAVNERYRESFYENRPLASLTADQSVSSQLTPSNQHQPGHSSQNWSTQQLDDQNQEVRKKAEEFLRILEASNRNELTGDKSGTRDRSSEKQASRARSRSRGKSRPRSRSRSRGRSRGHSRARSRCRGKSRPRSRTRSRSRAKSRTRAKSRPRSRSRSHSRGRSATRAKSQPRQSQQSCTVTTDNNYSFTSTSGGPSLGSGAMPDVFYRLKHFLQSKELEKHLPLVKNALLRNQSADDTKGIMLGNQPAVGGFQNFEPSLEPETSAGLNYGSLLPHERAGGNSNSFSNILSWNTHNQQPETKPMFNSVEDEEKFLYGEEEERAKPQAVTVPLAQTISVRSPVHQLVKESKVPSVQLAGSGTTKVTAEECEKVRSLLKAVGLNPGMADICKMAAKLKEKEEQGGVSSLSQLRPALEALQALSRASRSDDSQSNRSGSSHSNRDSKCEEKKMDEKERERREKQIHKKRKEYLVKELEGLLKQEGSGDLIPVMGFFCQRCEEFFGDLNSAEKHAESHGHSDKNQMGSKEQHSDAKRNQPSSHRRESPPNRFERPQEHSPDRKRIRDDKHSKTQSKSESEGSTDKRDNKSRDKQEDDNNAELTKTERKKQKKEKKLKKKEKKKKKDKKKAALSSP